MPRPTVDGRGGELLVCRPRLLTSSVKYDVSDESGAVTCVHVMCLL